MMKEFGLPIAMGITAILAIFVIAVIKTATKPENKVMVNHLLLHQNHAGSIAYDELEQMAPLHSYAYGDALLMLEYFDVDEPQDTYIAHVMTPENGWTHITSNSVEGMFTQVRKILK